MPAVAAVLFCALLAALAVFQVALIAGAPLGNLAWGGQDRVLPPTKRVGSGVSVALYAAFALLALERAELIDLVPAGADAVVRVLTWIVFAYLVLGIPMNLISRSKAERYVMAPVAAVLAVLAVLVALA